MRISCLERFSDLPEQQLLGGRADNVFTGNDSEHGIFFTKLFCAHIQASVLLFILLSEKMLPRHHTSSYVPLEVNCKKIYIDLNFKLGVNYSLPILTKGSPQKSLKWQVPSSIVVYYNSIYTCFRNVHIS